MALARRIVLFTKNGENPNYVAMVAGARRIAEAAGAELVWRTTQKPDDPVEQTVMLRETINERPDGLIFAPADDKAMQGPVSEANAAGIPIVGFVNRMPGQTLSFVGADDVAMARLAATALIAAIGGRGNVVLIEGPETAPTARDRGRGFREAIAASPDVRLLGTEPGFYLKSGGCSAMERLLSLHPIIDGVISTNDTMALGAVEACEKAGRQVSGRRPGILIIGNNGTIEAAEAIKAGRLFASMDYDGFKMGAIVMMAMLRHLDGRTIPAEIMLPTTVITAENCERWLVPIEARPLPAWEDVVPGGNQAGSQNDSMSGRA